MGEGVAYCGNFGDNGEGGKVACGRVRGSVGRMRNKFMRGLHACVMSQETARFQSSVVDLVTIFSPQH